MIKIMRDSDEVIDFVWELGQNKLYCSYPRKQSRKEVETEIERAIHSESHRMIACYQEDRLCGVCVYFWEEDDRYIQTTEFLIREDYERTADELIACIADQLPGFELLIGVPLTNTDANQYFNQKKMECVESSIDTRVYDLKLYEGPEYEQIEQITEESFEEYALFHDRYAIPLKMYYNSTNLKRYLQNFRIFVFRQGGEIRGSIFVFLFKGGAEVFGLFLDDRCKHRGMEGVLINKMLRELHNELGVVKEIVYFIDENCSEELDAALDAGFEVKDRYRCYNAMNILNK